MAPKAGQLWELLLQQLSKLAGTELASNANAVDKLTDEVQLLTGRLSALPRLPHNIWASLVEKQQVPRRVIDTCHRLSEQLSSSQPTLNLRTQHPGSSARAADTVTDQLGGLVTNLLLMLTSALLDLPPGPNSNALLQTVQRQLAQKQSLELLTVLWKHSNLACAELVAQAHATSDGRCFVSSSSSSSCAGGSSSSDSTLLVGSQTARVSLLSIGKWPSADLFDAVDAGDNERATGANQLVDQLVDHNSSSSSNSSALYMQLAMVSAHFCMLAVVASMMQAYFERDTQLKASSTYKAYLSTALTATEQAMRAAWTCAACLSAPGTQQGTLSTADQAQPARKMFMAGYKLTLQLLAKVGCTGNSGTAATAAGAAGAAPMYSQQEDDKQLRLLTSMLLTTVVSLTFPSQPASSSCSSTPNTANASQQQQQQQQQQQYIKSTAWLNLLADLTGCYTANIFWAAQILTDQIRWEFRMQNLTDLVVTYTRFEQEKTAAGQPVTYMWNRFTLFLPTLLFEWAASCRSLASSRTDYAQVVGCAAQGALTSFLQCSVAACLLGVRKTHSSSSGSSGTADWSAPVLHPLLHVFQQPIVVIVRSLEWELGKVNSGLKRPITEMLQALLAQLKADMRSYGPVKTDSSLSCSLSSNSSGGRDSASSSSGGGGGGDSTGSSSGGRLDSSNSDSSLSGDLLVQRSSADRIASTLNVLRLLLHFTEALLCSTDSLEAAQVHNPRHVQHLSAAAEKYPLAVQCFKTWDAIARLSIHNASTRRIEASFPAVGYGSGSLLLWDCTGPAGQQGDSSAAEVWVPGPLLKQAFAAGPGSAEQRKLISCCCSLTKVVQRQVVSPAVPLVGPRGSAHSGTGLRAGSVQPAGSCTWSNLEGAWSTLPLAARSVVAILDAGTAALRERCGGNSSSSSSRGSSSNSDQGSTSDGGSSSESGSSASWATDEVHHSTCSNYGNTSVDGAAKEKHPCPCKPQGWPCPPVSCSWSDFTGNCRTWPVFQQFGNASAYAAADELQPDNMAAAATMTALLPCLAVLGRCCLLWSGMVPALMQDVFRSALTLSASQNPALDSATNSTVQSALEARVAARDHITAMEQQILQVQALVGDVLVACGMPLPAGPPALLQGQASLLSAAGISAVDDVVLQASLQQAHTALGAAAAAVQELSEANLMISGSVHVQAKALSDRRRRVQKDLEVLVRCFGRTVMVKNLCNNYLCSNLQGLSEGGIVKGRGHMCSGCRTARYCSRECQEQHWELHKGACGELKKRGGARGMSSRSDGCSDSSSLGDS